MNKHPLSNCEKCPWRDESTYVADSGPEDAKILVVGEAPGFNEIRKGETFTGPSGLLMRRVLDHHKLEDVRFTNAAMCHPPYKKGQAKATDSKAAIQACKGKLDAELQNRDGILVLGNTATASVLGIRGAITSIRQGPARVGPGGANTVASVHPAACLRSGDFFPSLVKDVGKLRRALTGHTSVGWQEPEYLVLETFADVAKAFRELIERGEPIAVDIECGVEKDHSFTHPDVLLSVGISYETNKAVVVNEEMCQSKAVHMALRKLLNQLPVIYHNGKYDIQVLMRVGIIKEPKQFFDTMLASYAIDERPGHHGLGGLAIEILGAPDWKDVINQYIKKGESYALIPRPVLYKYNAYDVCQTYLLYKHFLSVFKESPKLRILHDMLVAIAVELAYVEFDGIGIDLDHLDKLTEEYLAELAILEARIQELSLPGLNPRSPKQLKEYFASQKMYLPSTGVEILENAYKGLKSEKGMKQFLAALLQYRKTHKLYSTYVKGARKRLIDGRLYPTYMVHGTVFGRLAARNPNIHNVPRASTIKALYVPARRDNVFVQSDYSQAELRVMACEARDPYLRDVFSDRTRDIHNEVSDTLYGKDNWNKEQRVRTKAFVFGSAYGREPFSIASEFGISVQEAQSLYNGLMDMIPKVVEWRSEIQHQVFGKGQALETHFNRKRRFWLITNENKSDIAKECLAFKPQSISADLCLLALAKLRQQFGFSENSPRIRITVHDSIVSECHASDADEVGRIMSQTMMATAAELYSDYVPFVAEPETGSSWGELG